MQRNGGIKRVLETSELKKQLFEKEKSWPKDKKRLSMLSTLAEFCHAPIHSDPSDSFPVISDCFWVSSLLVYHLPAPCLAPLDGITFISFTVY